MTTQEEWRRIQHERRLGEASGKSGGSIWGREGADKYHKRQKEAAERQASVLRSIRNSFGSADNRIPSGTPDSPNPTKETASWGTANSVFALIGFVAGLYLFRSFAVTSISHTVAFALGTSGFVGKFYKLSVVLAILYCACLWI
jgi:hypothetical protein